MTATPTRGTAKTHRAAGIELLQTADVVHVIGGGYLASIWPRHIGVLAAGQVLAAEHGKHVAMTGVGLLPSAASKELLDQLTFAVVPGALGIARQERVHHLPATLEVPAGALGDDAVRILACQQGVGTCSSQASASASPPQLPREFCWSASSSVSWRRTSWSTDTMLIARCSARNRQSCVVELRWTHTMTVGGSSDGTTDNRDASLIFNNEEIAAYYERAFLHDWNARSAQRDGERLTVSGRFRSGLTERKHQKLRHPQRSQKLRDYLEGE